LKSASTAAVVGAARAAAATAAGAVGGAMELEAEGRKARCEVRQAAGADAHRCWNFFIYLICHDFRKIIGRIKIFDKCTSDAVAHGVRLLPSYRTALGVPTTAGHGGRGSANGRQHWSVGLVPNAAAHGVSVDGVFWCT
jgi:hypothetical protein